MLDPESGWHKGKKEVFLSYELFEHETEEMLRFISMQPVNGRH